MNVLVDTQCYYWGMCDREKLSRNALAALMDPQIIKRLSVTVFWEISIKSTLGKLKLPKAIEELWSEAERDGLVIIPICKQHLKRLSTLPHYHRDPFDRLMISQALAEDWEVVSSDDQWDAYGVRRIW